MTDDLAVEAGFDFHGDALDNIFSTYSRLRAGCPVGRSEKYDGFWYLTKNDDIFAAEQDPGTFLVAPSMLLPDLGAGFPMIPLDIDPPEHSRYRRILLPLFTRSAVARLEDGMRRTARQLLQQMSEQDVVDASALYARPMPTIVFSRLAGFPEQDWPKFDAWVGDIIYERTTDPARAHAAAREVVHYFDHLLRARRGQAGGQDLIGQLHQALIDGRALTQSELVSYCYLLFVAGLDTTAWAIRSSLWYLARNPEDQERLRRQPGLIPVPRLPSRPPGARHSACGIPLWGGGIQPGQARGEVARDRPAHTAAGERVMMPARALTSAGGREPGAGWRAGRTRGTSTVARTRPSRSGGRVRGAAR
jgi:cytochrome P450